MSIIDKISTEVVWDKFLNSIEKSDIETILLLGEAIEQRTGSDPIMAKFISEPSTIKEVHDLLVEKLRINPKLLMLKKPVQNRQTRSVLLIRAIINAVKR